MLSIHSLKCCKLVFTQFSVKCCNCVRVSRLVHHSAKVMKTNKDQSVGKDHKPDSIQFSLSKLYPDKMKLHQKQVDVHDDTIDLNKFEPGRYIALTIAFSMTMYVAYQIYFGDYNLEVEENLAKTLPGYEKEMSKFPQYEERITALKEKRAIRPPRSEE